MLKEQNVQKIPGCSWIEVECRVHQFHSADETHPRAEEIYNTLGSIFEFLVSNTISIHRTESTKDHMLIDLSFKTKILLWSKILVASVSIATLAMQLLDYTQVKLRTSQKNQGLSKLRFVELRSTFKVSSNEQRTKNCWTMNFSKESRMACILLDSIYFFCSILFHIV